MSGGAGQADPPSPNADAILLSLPDDRLVIGNLKRSPVGDGVCHTGLRAQKKPAQRWAWSVVVVVIV